MPGNKVSLEFDSCCGKDFSRTPYSSNGNLDIGGLYAAKKCCDNQLYDPAFQTCCDSESDTLEVVPGNFC